MLIVRDNAKKQLNNIPKRDADRIREIIEMIVADPYLGDIERMKDEKGVWRRRVGSYRIFYELRKEQGVIYVFNIERRTSKTY
ncbi:MAG: type II toxin-antitoxin system RelE/ParE family toxin [Patescibacteria group bacterium]